MCCHKARITDEIHWGKRLKDLQGRTLLTVTDKQQNSLPQCVGKTKGLKGVKMMIWMKVITLVAGQQ